MASAPARAATVDSVAAVVDRPATAVTAVVVVVAAATVDSEEEEELASAAPRPALAAAPAA
jgi:hypothetical protein